MGEILADFSIQNPTTVSLVVGLNVREKRNLAEVAHSVEHDLAKVGVASSSLVFRSISPSSSAGRATDL